MVGAFRVEAYVIVSADGMLADATGVQPASLHFEADQRHFEKGLDRAGVIVNGRNSAEAQPESARRRRLVLTRRVAGVAPDPDNPKARLWNPAGASLDEACAALGLVSGTVAVIGGPRAFTLFLKLGYDCFHLSRAMKVRLPGGLPLFGADPDAALAGAGLVAGPPQWLEDGLTLTDWKRAEQGLKRGITGLRITVQDYGLADYGITGITPVLRWDYGDTPVFTSMARAPDASRGLRPRLAGARRGRGASRSAPRTPPSQAAGRSARSAARAEGFIVGLALDPAGDIGRAVDERLDTDKPVIAPGEMGARARMRPILGARRRGGRAPD